MDDALSRLTDREREVLRLLVNGHEIKSIARELSISVSAVTDRLRSARRKLGASTSREAARTLAQGEFEPRFGVHSISGDAIPSNPRQRRLSKKFAGTGIAMLVLITAAATLFSLTNGRGPKQSYAAPQFIARSSDPRHAPARIQVSVAELPATHCGHALARSQGGRGFTLQCAVHPGPHPLPLRTDGGAKLRPVRATAPPLRAGAVRVQPIPLTAERATPIH